MKKKNVGFLAAVGLTATLLLGACNSGGDYEFISIATGGTTGTYYSLGGTLANIISEEAGVETTAEVASSEGEAGSEVLDAESSDEEDVSS